MMGLLPYVSGLIPPPSTHILTMNRMYRMNESIKKEQAD
jgi:hypothetical protein